MAGLRHKCEVEKRLKDMSAKERLIGIDVGTLNQQVEEKRHRELNEKQLEECDDAHQLLIGNHMNIVEMAKQQKRKDMEAETQAFNDAYLKKEDRREFYLNDPNMLKNQDPTRMIDHDPRLGVSSAQILVGEDILKRERHRVQHNQQRSWIQAQLYEKTLKEEQKKQEDQDHHENQIHVHNLLGAIEDQEAQARQELARRVAASNRTLIARKNERTAKADEDRKIAEKADLDAQYNSAFLNDGPVMGKNGQMVTKTTTLDEKIAVRNCQTAQLQNKRAAEIAQAQEQMVFDQQTEQTRRMLLGIEKERRDLAKANTVAALEENKKIAAEQRARKEAQKREQRNMRVENLFEVK